MAQSIEAIFNDTDKGNDIDKICAQLTDVFGELVSPAKIYETGIKHNWDMTQCMEDLIKVGEERARHKAELSDEPSIVYRQSFNGESNDVENVDADVDIVIESEADVTERNVSPTNQWTAVVKKPQQKSASPIKTKQSSRQRPFENTNGKSINDLKSISQSVYTGKKILILMRGLPGSGKSQLCNQLITHLDLDPKDHIFSADAYFVDNFGNYQFNPSLLSLAHEDCRKRTEAALKQRVNPVVVDNTNIKIWEMEIPCRMAIANGYQVRILEPKNYWSLSPYSCANKNVHNVPLDTIKQMHNNYEPVQNVNQLLKNFGLNKYKPASDAGPSIDWTAHERSVDKYWRNVSKREDKPKPPIQHLTNSPKPQTMNLQPGPSNLQNHIMSVLQIPSSQDSVKEEKEDEITKHRKGCRNENPSFREIRTIFPKISIDYLWDLFEKCFGDAEWMTDILLNDKETKDSEIDNLDDFTCNCDDVVNGPIVTEEPMTESSSQEQPEIVLQKPKQRGRRQIMETEEGKMMKRELEEKFILGEEFYTDNMKRIRGRRGNVPWTKRDEINNVKLESNPEVEPEPTSSQDTGGCLLEDDEEDEDDRELLEVDLGKELVQYLENTFNYTGKDLSLNAFQTNVFMPKSLAKQIYTLWVESMMNQLEEQKQESTRDDEEIARLFQASHSENTQLCNHGENKFTREPRQTGHLKEGILNDLAAHLTQVKLYETFPNVEKETLDDLMVQNNFRYQLVVDILNGNTVVDKKSLRQEYLKLLNDEEMVVEPPSFGSPIFSLKPRNTEETKRQAMDDFEENRNLAQHHHYLKAACHQKTREAIQKRQHSVASYYSEVASFHKSKIDHYNHLAANSIVTVHDLTHQKCEILDLHYLQSAEAIAAVDIFIDSHIVRLGDRNVCKTLFLITGRGLHSYKGIAWVKIRVCKYLKQRGIAFREVNPGLLRLKVTKFTKLTSQFRYIR